MGAMQSFCAADNLFELLKSCMCFCEKYVLKREETWEFFLFFLVGKEVSFG